MPLIGRIACLLEVIPAFLGGKEFAYVADRLPKLIDGPGPDASEVGLELGEGHFDGIEIRAIGRSEEKPGAAILEDGSGLFAFMAGKIVEDYDVARIERRGQLGFNPCFKDHTVHGAVDDPGRDDAIATQASDESLRFPMPKGRTCLEPLPAARTAPQARHLRRCCRFINENKPMRLLAETSLAVYAPHPPRIRHVIAPALRCQKCFF